MIQLLQWPPQKYSTYSVRGRVFEWKEDEPFVVFMKDGSVDTDPKRLTPGFVNRVQRYGRQNGFNESEWELEKIYFDILQRIPLPLRARFFRSTESTSPTPMADLRPHDAPVPSGLAKAAKLDVVDSDPDLPLALAAISADEWVKVLSRWVKEDPVNREPKTVSGPVWWWSAHSVSKNTGQSRTTPLHFIGLWLGSFPCRKCRINARRYIAKHPVPNWGGFEAWVNSFHLHVTASKKP